MLSCMVHQPAIGASLDEICKATEAQAQCLSDMGCLTDTQKAIFDVTLSGCVGDLVPDMDFPDIPIPDLSGDLGDTLGDAAECAEKQLNCVSAIPHDISSLEAVCSYNENLIQCYTDSGCFTDALKSEMESAMAQCSNSAPGSNLPMIAGIVSGVVAAGAAGVYVWKKKKKADDASLPTVHRSGLNNLEKL